MQKYAEVFEEFAETYLPAPCPECGNTMGDIDAFHYERCEMCELEEFERIENWRAGNTDEGLDERFSIPKETRH